MDLPIKNGGSFHKYVSLPEGNHYYLGLLLTTTPCDDGTGRGNFVFPVEGFVALTFCVGVLLAWLGQQWADQLVTESSREK